MHACRILHSLHCTGERCRTVAVGNVACTDVATWCKAECEVQFLAADILVVDYNHRVGRRAEVPAHLACAVALLELHAGNALFEVEVTHIVDCILCIIVGDEQRTKVHECAITAACTDGVCRAAPQCLLVKLYFLALYLAEHHASKLTVTQWQCILLPCVA